MKAALLDYLVCPLDYSPLEIYITEQSGDQILTGELRCLHCEESFPIKNGIPSLLSPRVPGMAAKLGEAAGWVEMARNEAWYQADDRFDLALPYVVERLDWDPAGSGNWIASQVSLDHLLAHYVRPGMRVLEVGAAKSWAGHYFIERGCEYTACDILDDPNIGVGRSRFFSTQFGYYEAVAADGEALPFKNAYFDVVFAIAALHHALDLSKMLNQMTRVCKPGGVVAGLNEGVRAIWARADAGSQAKEKTWGINEHVHTLRAYTNAFRQNGLHIQEIRRSVGYDQLIAPRLKKGIAWMRRVPRVGDRVAPWLVLGVIHKYDGVSLYARKAM